MKYIYLVLNWLFGLLFLLAALGAFFQAPLAGLACIAIALLLLPPVRKFLYAKTNRAIPAKARAIAIGLLFISFVFFISESEERKRIKMEQLEAQRIAQIIEQRRQGKIEHFEENSDQILGEIRREYEASNFRGVVDLSREYLPSEDPELLRMHDGAKAELEAIAAAERAAKEKATIEARTEEILAQLKKIPEAQYAKNRDLYAELVKYHPSHERYTERLAYYEGRVKEAMARVRAQRQKEQEETRARIAKFGEPPKPSPWDGSYYEVERFLKTVANDPDSIDMDACTKVYHTSKGWLVGCDYRGRNAFGGLIRQANWFTIVHGKVIDMEDASAYSH